MIKRALISVFDKTGVVELAKKLQALGVAIISTGGTLKTLREAGVEVQSVSDITGFPECLDGRVKTLHPKVHGGILAMRGNPDHMGQLEEHGIETIDLVVINLYPFRQTILKEGVTLPEAIENIDIGGPTMLRAAAKNFEDVTVVVDPLDYGILIGEMQAGGNAVSRETRLRFSEKVFAHTAQYDALISSYLRGQIGGADPFPQKLTLTYERADRLRYGENPHQEAALYREVLPVPGTLMDAVQLGGKTPSFNNLRDADTALHLLREFDETAVVAVKQSNPCGAGVHPDLLTAWEMCAKADRGALFGCVVALNREVDARLAEKLRNALLDVVIAPAYQDDAIEILCENKHLRILRVDMSRYEDRKTLDFCRISGGMLAQETDDELFPDENIRIVTEKNPTPEQTRDAVIAWKIAKYVHSNAIVIVKDGQALGIGPGQPSRALSLTEAISLSGEEVRGAALASDAFLQFPQGAEMAAEAGIGMIIQPGGSPNDAAIIEVCDKHDMVMLFTEMRHFKH